MKIDSSLALIHAIIEEAMDVLTSAVTDATPTSMLSKGFVSLSRHRPIQIVISSSSISPSSHL